ncbi:Nicastrin [Bagarius yarrelli]|uniref:Nicastrin n=1 Tax=Bagarius yarrelli TaxID=175774 RepID=A0A556UGC2_BAGYA|nr:Nicastrin [Bagarius yarrelli]
MGPSFLKWIQALLLSFFYAHGSCSSVEQKIYVTLKNTTPCVRLLNATHQIGCQSSISGDTGVLHVLETENDLEWIAETGPHAPYMVLMESLAFTRCCVYTELYGPELANCNATVWKSTGERLLSYEDFPFPIFSLFSLPDDNETQVIRKLCDPLMDYNVWATIRPINATAKGHKQNESMVIAATRETFDYIGSSRMVYDMQNNKSVIDFDNVHSFLEIGQVGLWNKRNMWMHSDPISRRNVSVNEEVGSLVSNIKSAASTLNLSLDEPNATQALPPSSFQRFLRVRPIPGVVLADHQSSFINKYYESLYDTAEYLKVSYPPDLSPEEQLEYETEAAKLLYGFLVNSNNSYFRSLLPRDIVSKERNSIFSLSPPQYYVSLSQNQQPKSVTTFVKYVLANMTGTATSLNQSQCQNPKDVPGESKDLYLYDWVYGSESENHTKGEPFCVRAPVRLAKAVSPAFELQQYGSKEYSTWTESRWKKIEARIFLVASPQLQMLTLGVGIAVLLVSLLGTYFISSKADILFSSSHDAPNTTY